MTTDTSPTIDKTSISTGPDPDGPEGNHGQVTCAVCKQPGWLAGADERGFLIDHPRRLFPCRAPR